MPINITTSEDGSSSLYSDEYGEHYHSVHGALAESRHIFINAGLYCIEKNAISILELGFGSGLNALLSLEYAMPRPSLKINYTGIEKHPIGPEIIEQLNYAELLRMSPALFRKLHNSPNGAQTQISTNFFMRRLKQDIRSMQLNECYDLIYFDAFSPEKQADLWTESVFSKIYSFCNPKARLLTYSAKGTVKQALRKAGFQVKRLPGPQGKRHILLAIRET
jgi:tRNA U34 5-methylaminomethyl-2-thiouridine-forming methyltransferase MnmC